MLFEHTVCPFDRVVLAMVRRIVGKLDFDSVLICEIYGSFNELCPPALAFGTIILVQD